MSVQDHGIEVLKKSGEEVSSGDKSDYYIKVGPTPGHPLEFQLAEPDTPVIYNLVSPGANTEFSQSLAGTVRKLTIRSRGLSSLKLYFSPGASNYLTIPGGATYYEDTVKLVGATIYLQTSLASETVEVLTWT